MAYADDADGILFSLETLLHMTDEQLVSGILAVVSAKKVDQVIVGLPLLPSGEEGSQSRHVRSIGDALLQNGLSVRYIDERYSTNSSADGDNDSAAACSILSVILKS